MQRAQLIGGTEKVSLLLGNMPMTASILHVPVTTHTLYIGFLVLLVSPFCEKCEILCVREHTLKVTLHKQNVQNALLLRW